MSDEPHAILFLAARGKVFRLQLTQVITVIGAATAADIRVELPGVSQRHFRITLEGDRYLIEDLASAGGTFLSRADLDESRLVEEAHLLANDTLRIGAYHFHFVIPAPVSEAPVLIGEKASLRLPPVCVVGHGDAGINIIGERVSLRHASIETYAPDAVYLIDLVGTDVTTRNGKPVTVPVRLKDGDVIAFAGHQFKFKTHSPETTLIATGQQRRFSGGLQYDPQHKQVIEGEGFVSQRRSWRTVLTAVLDALQSRRGVMAARIVFGLVALGFLAFPFHQTVECECRVAASAVQKIRAPVSGRIQKVYVKEGDKVRQNELLMRVVDRGLQLEKARIDKEVASARDAVERASAEDRRFRMNELYARRERAERELDRVDTLLDQSDVHAGIAGRLMTPTPETLENTVVSIGQELVEIASTSHVYVETLVPEIDMDEIVLGQHIHANFYTDMSREYVGEIQTLAPVAEKGALGSFIIIKAPLDNSDDRLIPGTTGVAKIIGRRHPGIVLLWKRIARTFK